MKLYLTGLTILTGIMAALHTSTSFALVQYGSPCLTDCECCEVMMEYMTTNGSNELTNTQLVVKAMMSIATSYPYANSRPTLLNLLQKYDIQNLAEAWLGVHGKLSSLEICDWATYSQVCQAGCMPRNPTPGGPQDCGSRQVWQTNPQNPGVQTAQKIEFFCFDCFALNQGDYRCAAGYYGQPQSADSSDCKKCPTPGTSTPDTTDITGCYIKQNTEFSDEKGTFIYSSPCYYSE